MDFMEKEKQVRLGSGDFSVKAESAKLHAQFHLYCGIAARFQGFEGWEQGNIADQPTTIYDLSGLPLFYDFPINKGSSSLGFIRTAATKVLGDSVVSTSITWPKWDIKAAQEKIQKSAKEKYPKDTIRSVKLVCYSYPKLALSAELVSPKGDSKLLLIDIGDLTEMTPKPGPIPNELGQVPYSFLNEIPEDRVKAGPKIWEQVNQATEKIFKKESSLEPSRMYALTPKERLKVIDKVITALPTPPTPLPWYTQKTLHFCSHHGGYHECFCLHPQENSVHCARASAQMMLCYWRFKYSQHEIAQAFGVPDNVGTPLSAVVPGLEQLTHNCFDATQISTMNWNTCVNEINERRPFMSCIPGHARACAGVKWWNIWPPQPRFLYIFDPWPPQADENSYPIVGGAIYWENFNTTTYWPMYTLVRRTTTHL